MIIMPATCILVAFWISLYISNNLYFVVNFTTVITIASYFIFYKFFDKYLQNPLLRNSVHNPNFHLNLPFFMSVLATGSTFVIELLTPSEFQYPFLPVILFCVVYSFIWFYLRLKSIDKVDYPNKNFEKGEKLADRFFYFHNSVLIVNFIIQFIFLLLFMQVRFFSASNITINVVAWIITGYRTRKVRKRIAEGILQGKGIKEDLSEFSQNFIQGILGVCSLPFIEGTCFIVMNDPAILAGSISALIAGIYGILISIIYFLLVEMATYSGRNKIPFKAMTFHARTILVLVSATLVASFAARSPILTILAVVAQFFFIIINKREFCLRIEFYRLIHYLTTVSLFGSIAFACLPVDPSIQVAVFSTMMYLAVKAYHKEGMIDESRIIWLQDIFCLSIFAGVTIATFPGVFQLYTSVLSRPEFTVHAMVLLIILLSSIVALCMYYRIFFTRILQKTSRVLKLIFSTIFSVMVVCIIGLVALNTPFTTLHNTVNFILLTALIVPFIYIAIIFLNTLPGIFFMKNANESAFHLSIAWIAVVPALIIFNFFVLAGFFIGLFILTIELGYYLKWGETLKKISNNTLTRFLHVARPALVAQMLIMQFFLYTYWGLDWMLSTYIAFIVTTVIGNLAVGSPYFSRATVRVLNIVAMCFTSAVIFRYTLEWTIGTPYVFVVPGLVTSLFTNWPLYYIFNAGKQKRLFPHVIFGNAIILSVFLCILPTAIMIDAAAMYHAAFNIYSDIFFTIIVAFLVFSAFSAVLKEFKIKPAYLQPFRWGMAATMAGISIFSSLAMYSTISRVSLPIFFPATIAAAVLTAVLVNYLTTAILAGFKMLLPGKIDVLTRTLYFGFTIALATLLTTLVQLAVPIDSLPMGLGFLGISWYVLCFFATAFCLSVIPRFTSPKRTVLLVERIFSSVCWLVLNVVVCIIFTVYLQLGTITSAVSAFIAVFTGLSPITLGLLQQVGVKLSAREKSIQRTMKVIFLIASEMHVIERLWASSDGIVAFLIPFTATTLFTLLFIKMMLASAGKFSTFMMASLVIFFTFIYMPTLAGIVFTIGTYLVTARVGKVDTKTRWLRTAFLSFVSFTSLLVFHGGFGNPISIAEGFERIYAMEFTACLIMSLLYSTITTGGKKSHIEGAILAALASLLMFQALFTFTPLSLFHDVNLTCVAYFALLAWYFKAIGTKKYVTLLKFCVLATIIYITTGICSIVFVEPGLEVLNNTMTGFTTYNVLAFVIIRLFRDLLKKYQKYGLGTMLLGFNILVPLTVYLVFTFYVKTPLEQSILLCLCIDIGFFLCFLTIGMYRWKLSRDVWKIGWWLWLVFPLVNFYLIFKTVQGVDVIDALNFFTLGDISGSGIITLVMITAMYLPIIHYKIKKYYYPFMFVLWGESLFIVGWVSQNLFPTNVLISAVLFLLFSTGLLLPLFYKIKAWKALMIAWTFLIICNAAFLYTLLASILIPAGFLVSIELISIGILAIVLAYIPQLPGKKAVLLSALSCLLGGLFSLIFFMFYAITGQILISINIACIIIAFSMFASKYLPVNQKKMRAAIAIILMANLSLLTFNSIAIFPSLLALAIFAGIAVFGGSFYTLNHYQVIFHVNRRIPWAILGIGTSLSVASMIVAAWQAPPMVIGFTLSFIALLFFAKELPWIARVSTYPLPVAFLGVQIAMFWLRPEIGLLISYGCFIYTLLLQICVNAVARPLPAPPQQPAPQAPPTTMLKVNAVLNICNSVLLSVIVCWTSQALIVLLILLPILLQGCITYIKRNGIAKEFVKLPLVVDIASILLHIILATSLTIVVPTPGVPAFIPVAIADGVGKATMFCLALFFQFLILDAAIFKLIRRGPSNFIMFCTYLLSFNILAGYLLLFHSNGFLMVFSTCIVNLPATWFWQKIDPKQEKRAIFARKVLANLAFMSGALFISSLISLYLPWAIDPAGAAPWLLFFTTSFLLLFLINMGLNKTLPKAAETWYQLALYLGFQVCFGLFWARVVMLLAFPTLLSFSILAFIETLFGVYSYTVARQRILKRQMMKQAFSPLIIAVYLELTVISFAISNLFLGPYESAQIALVVLFLFSIAELVSVQSIKKQAAYVLNLIAYVPLTIVFLLYATSLVLQLYAVYMLALSAFMAMQQYTLFAIFSYLKEKRKGEYHLKARMVLKRVFGIAMYALICMSVQGFLSGFQWYIQFVALSIVLFFLALFDRAALNFLGKRISSFLILAGWTLLSLLITGALVLVTAVLFFIPWLFPCIPIAVVIEVMIGTKALGPDYQKKHQQRKYSVEFFLKLLFYSSLASWPICFWSQFAAVNVLLLLGTLIIFDIVLYSNPFDFSIPVDGKYVATRYKLDKIIDIFNVMICFLVASFVFSMMQSGLPGNVLINFTVAALSFTFLLGILTKPFKRSTRIKNVYWAIFSFWCSLLSISLTIPIAAGKIYVTFVLGGLVFFLMMRYTFANSGSTPAGKFRLNMIYYSISYGLVMTILFAFMTAYMIPTLLAIIIFGAILSVYIYFQEKKGVISIKYRLIASVSLIVLILAFIVVVVLMYLKVIPII